MLAIPISDAAITTKSTIMNTEDFFNIVLKLLCSLFSSVNICLVNIEAVAIVFQYLLQKLLVIVACMYDTIYQTSLSVFMLT